MNLFPFFQNIEGRRFLVVGGGAVAASKVEKLRMFTDEILVIAKETDIQGVEVCLREFRDSDIERGDFVIGATDDRQLNIRISELCRRKNKLVNIVDDPELCTFIFPALVKRGDLTVAVSTAGKSPVFSKYIRKEVERVVPDNTEKIIDELDKLKNRLRKEIPDQAERSRILREKLIELR